MEGPYKDINTISHSLDLIEDLKNQSLDLLNTKQSYIDKDQIEKDLDYLNKMEERFLQIKSIITSKL